MVTVKDALHLLLERGMFDVLSPGMGSHYGDGAVRITNRGKKIIFILIIKNQNG